MKSWVFWLIIAVLIAGVLFLAYNAFMSPFMGYL